MRIDSVKCNYSSNNNVSIKALIVNPENISPAIKTALYNNPAIARTTERLQKYGNDLVVEYSPITSKAVPVGTVNFGIDNKPVIRFFCADKIHLFSVLHENMIVKEAEILAEKNIPVKPQSKWQNIKDFIKKFI